MFDVVVRNGFVVDGTGNPWFRADVGVKDGKIARIGRISGSGADRVLDVTGLVVCPGFIDVHTHSELSILVNPKAETSVRMGATTHIVGNCGFSAAPLGVETRRSLLFDSELSNFIEVDWKTLREYFDRLERQGMAINIGSLVGHGTVRDVVMGQQARAPTSEELEEMRRLVTQAMEDGAFGLSVGLVYTPCRFAETSELIELCKLVARYGGIFAAHVRSQSDMYKEAIAEAIEIGEKSGVPAHLSHQGVMPPHWGEGREFFGAVYEARERGLDVTIDVIGGVEGLGSLNDMFPPWATDGGIAEQLKRLRDPKMRERLKKELKGETNWNRNIPALWAREGRWDMLRIHNAKDESLKGKTIAEAAKSKDKDPFEFLFDYLVEEGKPRSTVEIVFDEKDIKYMITLPFQMFCSDVWSMAPYGPLSRSASYPTQYGAYPWIFRRFVREEKLLTLEEAVRKMTSLPAQRFKLLDRGLIREGTWADMVIFNPKSIADQGTKEKPRQYPAGIEYVLVNGRITVEKGEHTGALAGKVLRHPLEN
jgi:N-acyl-D-aspartate/D-glutamate deacylase